jgi:hypothetical protein
MWLTVIADQLRLRERSTVIQRNLPRPLTIPKYKPPTEHQDLVAQAEELVRAEVDAILIHDAELFPISSNMPLVTFPDWDSFTDDELRNVSFFFFCFLFAFSSPYPPRYVLAKFILHRRTA